jgi:hypothetical protein
MLGLKTKKDRRNETKSRKRAEFVHEIRARLLKVAEAAADEALEQIQDLIVHRVEKAEIRAEAKAHASRRSSGGTRVSDRAPALQVTVEPRPRSYGRGGRRRTGSRR